MKVVITKEDVQSCLSDTDLESSMQEFHKEILSYIKDLCLTAQLVNILWLALPKSARDCFGEEFRKQVHTLTDKWDPNMAGPLVSENKVVSTRWSAWWCANKKQFPKAWQAEINERFYAD